MDIAGTVTYERFRLESSTSEQKR